MLGITEGYQTMDLLGAFFFCSVVIGSLKDQDIAKNGKQKNYKDIILLTLKASAIGASLLGMIYVGFSYLAAFNSESLMHVRKDELLATIALQTLGSSAGIVVSLAIALACLTTAIALAAVFAEYLQIHVLQNRVSYQTTLIVTMIISFFISTLDFMGIAAILAPILQTCYPALICLSIVNIAHKLTGFKLVKIPVFIVFALSLVGYAFGYF